MCFFVVSLLGGEGLSRNLKKCLTKNFLWGPNAFLKMSRLFHTHTYTELFSSVQKLSVERLMNGLLSFQVQPAAAARLPTSTATTISALAAADFPLNRVQGRGCASGPPFVSGFSILQHVEAGGQHELLQTLRRLSTGLPGASLQRRFFGVGGSYGYGAFFRGEADVLAESNVRKQRLEEAAEQYNGPLTLKMPEAVALLAAEGALRK